ncbi:hypothetical protein PILCRDRAFT_91959 [Piloderma croceum F 1598]|uniref:Uncharacterized protein n=1 Tax=Piloderma croceum (strain F 1598) TaxID=765440 RepID=A0A0C3F724_PILCF|nr:hypothetical protein PILCRDRAFT_91959 [Piloderma croceum F 1598]
MPLVFQRMSERQLLLIIEATPYIKLVLAHFTVEKPGEIDVIPLIYLCAALRKLCELAPMLNRANTGSRRAGVVGQCLCHRDWLHWHQFGMPLSEFVNLITDLELQGKGFIMEHPEMQKCWRVSSTWQMAWQYTLDKERKSTNMPGFFNCFFYFLNSLFLPLMIITLQLHPPQW